MVNSGVRLKWLYKNIFAVASAFIVSAQIGSAQTSAIDSEIQRQEDRVALIEKRACDSRPYAGFCSSLGELVGVDSEYPVHLLQDFRSNRKVFSSTFSGTSFIWEGQRVGVRVSKILPNSVVIVLGLENEDVVTAVAGKPVRFPDELRAALVEKELVVGSEFFISIVRQFKAKRLRVKIVDR